MAIIVDRDTKLVVQGLTGSEGSFHGLRVRELLAEHIEGDDYVDRKLLLKARKR